MSTAQCRICGMVGTGHQGTVDCINALRQWVVDLQSLLPEGKEVLRSTITREATARVWIDGEITHAGLTRLIQFIEFMREAWTEETEAIQDAASPQERVSQNVDKS